MRKEQRQDYDLVLPCYRPQEDWQETVTQSVSALNEFPPSRLIIVFDGPISFDENGFRARFSEKNPRIQLELVLLTQNKGKGSALREGVKLSQSPFCIFTDIDFPYESTSLLNLVQVLSTSSIDVCVGERQPTYYSKVPLFRKFLSKAFRWVLVSILKIEISDTQCGLKGFNSVGRRLFRKTTINRFLFDLEFVFLASNDPEISIQTVPVSLKSGVIFSQMNPLILLRELWNFFRIVVRNFRI